MNDIQALMQYFTGQIQDRTMEPLDNMPNFPRDAISTHGMELATRRPYLRPQYGPLSEELGLSAIRPVPPEPMMEMIAPMHHKEKR